ncbi:MAG: 23S rRNA (pseudouridine(1915)-N(3))-methyltransferase RlmH, partial [Clostridia bacterium]|nr:23S rRNA (pseudouridine(1915)-N(3))-methyltransferase RlmH [Clostridia bacterium]
MIGVKLITVGTLKEEYWRSASAEYQKRLGALCRFEEVQLKEEKLSERPSEAEIRAALDKEAEKILAQIPPRAYAIAMCVEGKQLSSEELAEKIEEVSQTHGEICLIIGSSYRLSER